MPAPQSEPLHRSHALRSQLQTESRRSRAPFSTTAPTESGHRRTSVQNRWGVRCSGSGRRG